MPSFQIRPLMSTVLMAVVTSLLAGCASSVGIDTVDTSPSEPEVASAGSYAIIDTMQTATFNATAEVPAPAEGEAFYGQDAQYDGNTANYSDNGDGTVTDNVTGLTWTQSPDLNDDGDIDIDDKLTYEEALAGAESTKVGGYDDWRLPTIKELYSLIDFNGVDPSGYQGTDTSGLVPFIDTDYFDFGYGDTNASDRIIDAQMASSTTHMDVTMNGEPSMFGVNFADGRIKGYGTSPKPKQPEGKGFYVYYVRGNTAYGINDYTDNGDGTVTDEATELMWARDDSGKGMAWEAALSWAEQANAKSYLGHSDWRLPNVKELQSIVDYTRSPGITDSAAIDPVFNTTEITNEAGESDYPWYWSSTTHISWMNARSGKNAVYVAFGRATGYMNGRWMDVHGAGSQRSDPKVGSASDYPEGFGPQGDARRIDNYVRLVRDAT
ncbi:MAG: DUF1566 domain-containing protein [Coriobacteriia bacterium]|nr:DUF1566 domain-containing protein [Coriobacteriia bacterium]